MELSARKIPDYGWEVVGSEIPEGGGKKQGRRIFLTVC